MFELDSRLKADCLVVGDLPLCRVLLMNDSQFPWLILVPQRAGVTEIIDLSEDDQRQLWQESAQISRALQAVFEPHKLNVAALGNVVSQLHMHHIARFEHDVAWPQPVWGRQAAIPYNEPDAQSVLARLRQAIQF